MSFELTTLGAIALGKSGAVDGPFGSNLKASCYVDSGIPVIRGSNLSLGLSEFKSDEFVYVGDDTFSRLSRSECLPQDIIFTKKGTLGQTGFVPNAPYKSYLVSSNQMRLRVDSNKANPKYVYYWVSSKKAVDKIRGESEHTGVPKINLDYLKKFPINLPSLVYQDKTVEILDSLNGKIALNTETNQTLEQMAQAIFKSWFVDFDPVKAKMNGEQPEGMNAATASLFPEKLVESELGLIPDGWEAGAVGSVTTAKGGYAFKSKQFIESGNPVIKIKNITSSGTVNTLDCQCVDDDVANTASRFKLSNGDLLMAMTGATVGKSGIYVSDGRDAYLNQRVARFESKVDSSAPCWFTYNLVTKDSIFEQIVGAAQGSAQPNISSKGIEQVKAVIPTHDLISKYQELVSPLYAKWISNFKENSQLSELRDTLLPKLLSGEIELGNAEESLND